MFVDESGMSLRPFRVRTWAPKGQTPTMQYSFNWKNLSVVGGITLRSIYFRMFTGSIKSEQIILFLRDLFRHLQGNVILIWDRLPAHRSKIVQEFLRKYRRVEQVYLPPYAPELNPTEYVWCNLKSHEIPNLCAENVGELAYHVRKGMRRIRRRPSIIASCWAQARLPI